MFKVCFPRALSAWYFFPEGYKWAMPSRVSAGLVPYRTRDGSLEVLLEHPGGPFFTGKDEGYWSIPKGETEPNESMLETALREVREEVGLDFSAAVAFIELGSIRQTGGKIVHAWGVECNAADPDLAPTQTFALEWPPHSGRFENFPEVDQAAFFKYSEALRKIKPAQIQLLERLNRILFLAPP
jgi:predicted NUDIX family NTP pyrophosphohydrolase